MSSPCTSNISHNNYYAGHSNGIIDNISVLESFTASDSYINTSNLSDADATGFGGLGSVGFSQCKLLISAIDYKTTLQHSAETTSMYRETNLDKTIIKTGKTVSLEMSYTFLQSAKVTINWPGNDRIALLEPVRNAYRKKTH